MYAYQSKGQQASCICVCVWVVDKKEIEGKKRRLAPPSMCALRLEWCSFRLCHLDFCTLGLLSFIFVLLLCPSSRPFRLTTSISIQLSVYSSRHIHFGCALRFRDFCRWINFTWSVASLHTHTHNLHTNTCWHIDSDILNKINWPSHFFAVYDCIVLCLRLCLCVFKFHSCAQCTNTRSH